MNLCSSAIYKLQHYFVSMWFVRNSSIYPHSIGQQITETDKSWNKIHRRTTRRLNLYSNDPYYYTITFNCWGKKKYDEWNFTSYVTLIFTSTFIWKLPFCFCFCWCEKRSLRENWRGTLIENSGCGVKNFFVSVDVKNRSWSENGGKNFYSVDVKNRSFRENTMKTFEHVKNHHDGEKTRLWGKNPIDDVNNLRWRKTWLWGKNSIVDVKNLIRGKNLICGKINYEEKTR